MLDPRWRRLARVRLYCNASCLAAIVVGCLVLCGWIFHIERLRSALLGSMSIEVNTAFGLILLGMSLWLLLPDPPRRAYRYGGLFFAALAAFIGAMTLIEYIFGLDLRIDRLFFSQDIRASRIIPLSACRRSRPRPFWRLAWPYSCSIARNGRDGSHRSS
jgi:hypothetical protein